MNNDKRPGTDASHCSKEWTDSAGVRRLTCSCGHSLPCPKEGLKLVGVDFEAWPASVPTIEEVLASSEENPLPNYRRDPDFVADLLKGMVAQAVREAMDARGTTPEALAVETGCAEVYVREVLDESANCGLESLARLACALDMEVKVVLHRKCEKVTVVPLAEDAGSSVAERSSGMRFASTPTTASTPLHDMREESKGTLRNVRRCFRCGSPVRVNGTCPRCLPDGTVGHMHPQPNEID